MDGSKIYNVQPEMAYPPPSYHDMTLNPNSGYYPNQGVYVPPTQYGTQNPQGPHTAVSVQPTVYVTQIPFSPPVSDYLGYSIFTMLCCCLPLGIAALVYSISTRDANNRGQRDLAERSSRTARILNNTGLGIGIAMAIVWIIIVTLYGRKYK